MYPTKEQAEAYKYFMNTLPKRNQKWISSVIQAMFGFCYLSPLIFFAGRFWLQWSEEKVSSMTYAFSSFLLLLVVLMTILTAFETLVLKVMSDKWLELKENTLKDVLYVKEPKNFVASFFTAKSVLFFLVVYAIAVNTTIVYAGWFAFFCISVRYFNIKNNNSEIAIIGQALIEKRFKPKKIGFIDKN